MSKGFKINTAIMICVAFLFRLLFINVNTISSLNVGQNGNHLKKHIASIKRIKRNADVTSSSDNQEYSAIEICEENPEDEDNLSKINPFVLLHVRHSSFSNVAESLKSNIIFDYVNCKFSSKKYLALSVLRI